MRERVSESEQNRGARAAVVRAEKAGFEQRVVVARENEDLLPGIGRDVELADDVVNGHRAAGRRRREVVGLDPRAVLGQHLLDELLGFLVTRRAWPALAETDDLRRIGKGLLRVERVVQGRRGGPAPTDEEQGHQGAYTNDGTPPDRRDGQHAVRIIAR